ncbi:MAG: serine/threonine-protein phosphatase [Actinomycetota bacterium]|nr:serine/threonine-protein phosphatase [Actinomycetota bacterium]
MGGDWYDVLELADGSVAVALGDVMGKGVPAAIVMGQVRSALRAYALLDPSPGLVLGRLDVLVSSLAEPEQIVTVAYGLVDRDRRSLTLALAGHPPPLRVPSAGPPVVTAPVVGPPLGLGGGPWPHTTIDLTDEATVLLYSDGLVESRSTPFAAGLTGLCEHIDEVESRRRNPRELCVRLGALVSTRHADDDVTMLALTSTASRRLRTAVEDLPADTSASPLARRFLRRRLADWGVDGDVVDTAQLCLSELVTNAIIHSGTPPRVTMRLDDERLLVLVQDHGSRGVVHPATHREPDVISGRGLALVEALTTAWSAERSADGTTVWFELDLPAPDATSRR